MHLKFELEQFLPKRKVTSYYLLYMLRGNLTLLKKKNSTVEKEALAVVWALKKHKNILLGYEIEVYTDHQLVSVKMLVN